jgi:hypothetical protein
MQDPKDFQTMTKTTAQNKQTKQFFFVQEFSRKEGFVFLIFKGLHEGQLQE